MTKANTVGISKTEDVEEGVPVISGGIVSMDFEEVKLGEEKDPDSSRTIERPPESRPYSKASSNRTTFISMGPFQRYKVDDLTNYVMNDQRWTLQRKKIGLKRKTSANKERKNRSMQTRDISLNFIRSNFARKECMKYVRDHKRSNLVGEMVCFCGNPIGKHESYKVPQYPFNFDKEDKKYFIRSVLDPQAMNGGGNYHRMPRIKEDSPDRTPYSRKPTIVVKDEGDSEGEGTNSEGGGEEDEENNPILKILEADGINQSQRRHLGKQKPVDSPIRNPITRLSPKSNSHWTPGNAMKEFASDAYGMIEFTNENTGSTKPAKYVRLADTSNLDAVLSLLTDYWRLMEPTRPNLAIAVIGGAKNFRLDGKKKETFNKGLISAVKSTNAWLLTGGMQVGVTKCVGEAVNEGQYIAKVKRKTMFQEEQEHLVGGIKCIGLAPWGYTRDNHLLINSDPNDFAYVHYKVDDTSERFKTLSLNGDHTHFLLVDDGIRNKYSGADKFRTELQKLIQEPEPIGLGVPVVLLLLDGGISSLFEVDMALKNNIPVVVVSNTGRAADLLAYGVSMTVMTKSGAVLRKGHKKQLQARVISTMPELNSNQCSNCVKVIVSCCENSKLMTIFDINSREGLDKYILYAVLKGGTKSNDSSKIDQLNLALLWNRPDIAECDIFPSSNSWPTDKLEDLMTTALLEEKVEFVRLFLTNGLIMTEYLTVQKLRMLYNETFSTETHFGRILSMCARGRHICLIHVHRVLEVLVKKHSDPVYKLDTPDKFQEDPTINYRTFDVDPYLELMIWAILNKRATLARFLWERCNSPLVAAIAATCIYTSLWNSLGAKNTEMREEYTTNRDMFEELAVKYLNQCFKHDSNNAMGIVERRNAKWGDLDCLQLAVAAEDLQFISCPCSQASIDISWRRGMMRAPVLGVIIANIFPFLIFTRLFRFQKLGDDGGELTAFQKMIVFYKSPISKFYSHTMVYICFLVLYAYVVLFDFRPIMSVSEKLVVGMIFTTFLEEIHQLLTEDPSSLGAKFTGWWSNVWNRFDVLSFWLSSTAFGLRMYPATFTSGRILFSVNTNFFYLRLFRIYHVSYKLGPKLVIFYRMISEVVVFLMILLIIILGYGIASQGLLHPRRNLSDTNFTSIVRSVILTPYWQMYGELLLDEIHGEDKNYCYVQNETCGWPFEETTGCHNEQICENPKNYTPAVSSMLVFYLIIGNIMLLNLLIAIFTYVFDEVQENSMEIWKYEMYKLIREFDNKPGLVPPFVVVEHMYRVLKLMWKQYCRKKKENLDDYMKETLKSLEIFEKQEMLFFLAAIKDRERDTIRSISLTMAARIDKIAKYIEQQEELKEIEEDLEYTVAEEAFAETGGGRKGGGGGGDETGTKGTRELSLDDLDSIENHRSSSATTRKVYLEGFSSLPFDVGGSPAPSRPGSPIYSRPVTGKKNRLATSRSKVRTQQEQIANLASQMNSLKLFVQDSMEMICTKLTNLESGAGSSNPASNSRPRLSLAPKNGILSKLDVNGTAKKRFSKSTAVQRPTKTAIEGGSSGAGLNVKKNENNDSGDGLSDYDDLLKDDT